MDSPDDKELVQQSVAGDLQAFEQLVYRYQDRLTHSLEHALGSREDALDAAQQAFISAWRSLSGFRQDSAFYSWLYRIAMNAAISARRRQRISTTPIGRPDSPASVQAEDQRPAADPSYQLQARERVQLVRSELLNVPEEFRQPLVLKEIDGMSYEQIADVLGIPVGTVRSRIFRARKELTERLQRRSEE